MAEYPSEKECKRLLEEYHVPENIVRHSLQVARIAVFLAKRLREKGIEIDVNLVRSAALLHDIAKASGFDENSSKDAGMTDDDIEFYKRLRSRYPFMKHNIVGYELFKDRYPNIAKMIRCHVFNAVIKPYRPVTWEEKIVNYADKRVAHDSIVSMSERNREGEMRWKQKNPGKEPDNNKDKIIRLNLELEKDIFSIIGIEPDRLEEELKREEMKG